MPPFFFFFLKKVWDKNKRKTRGKVSLEFSQEEAVAKPDKGNDGVNVSGNSLDWWLHWQLVPVSHHLEVGMT